MRILQFEPGCPPELAATETTGGNDRFFWLDVERSESDWQEKALPWLRVRLHDRHVQDTLNDTHPPYYDGMDDYDLLVVRALHPDCPPRAPETRPVAFILTGTAVVSVRPPGDPLFAKLHQRFLASKRKSPTSPAMLFYLLLDQVTNALLAHRESTSELLTQWQERLLDPDHKFDDWQPLMGLRGGLRRLEAIIEAQMDAVDEWREQTSSPLDASLAVRYNDLQEHLRRVYHHAVVVQQDIDALVQIYFSASAQRTNEILRFLTILSAVFLPLNLLAGLFGMNFTHLPLLAAWYGPWILIGVMLLLVSGLLLWFRRLRWL
ncbi:MAG: magnesium transporter CorA family protein [Chromatiaceae bacterium]|nr:magnesium transporter CorA family protein [Chromatiaceae bacterium]